MIVGFWAGWCGPCRMLGPVLEREAAALAAAEIPTSKLGPARRARLSEAERELYFSPADRQGGHEVDAMCAIEAVRSQGDACYGCCPVVNFFASDANAERWLVEHPDVRGNVISMQEAAAAGRAVFGDVLTGT